MKMMTSLALLAFFGGVGALSGAEITPASRIPDKPASRMPYRAAGLTERQAAAHLLDRFAYGARPGEVDRVAAMGLDRWLEAQLAGKQPDENLQARLASLTSLAMTNEEILRTFPQMNVVRNAAVREGVLTQAVLQQNPQEARRILRRFAREKGFRQPQDLAGELMAQKLLRAVYGENQLHEVLADFWFNHFNVSLTDNQARPYLLSYERDAIRPHVAGRFRDLLGATAKHPAMLQYLDNAQSNAPAGAPTLMRQAMQRNPGRNRGMNRGMNRRRRMAAMRNPSEIANGAEDVMEGADAPVMENAAPTMEPSPASNANRPNARRPMPSAPRRPNRRRGINENYARELMELHTLGVDGGYTQKDVVEVARALTGWTVFPQGPLAEQLRRRLERQGPQSGFVRQGDFLFRPDAHDSGAKTILGASFPAGRGMEEGERVLDMLSRHPSTAKFISRKLAVRFVSDAPPPALVDRLSQTFLRTDGDLKAMVRTLAESPEFWSPAARRAKIKSPFDLVASALRALDADVTPTRPLLQWAARMGQPLYAHQAPTGYPDRATAWVNTGSLLTRMNFGLQLAYGRIPGARVDLAKLNGNREPESAEAALKTYAALLLPERDHTETLRRLTPMVRDPKLAEKVDDAAPRPEPTPTDEAEEPEIGGAHPPAMLAQVVGVLLGSPEFQRR